MCLCQDEGLYCKYTDVRARARVWIGHSEGGGTDTQNTKVTMMTWLCASVSVSFMLTVSDACASLSYV